MLDLLLIKNKPEWVIEKLKSRGVPAATNLITEILELYQRRNQQQQLADQEKAILNNLSSSFQQLSPDKQQEKKEQIQVRKKKYQVHHQRFKELDAKLKEKLLALPNLPLDSTPIGHDQQENKIVRSVGVAKKKGRPHWELIQQYKLISFEQGNKITGAGFPVYKGQGAKLLRSLINFCLDQAVSAGYEEVYPPLLVNKKSATGTGQLPDKEGIMYSVQPQELYLIPTAEVPVTNLHAQELLTLTDFPIRYTAHTPCFRTESGSWGSNVRGLNRLKQFNKIELVEIHRPESSAQGLNDMLSYATGLLDKLGLTYRVVELCTGDLGQAAAKTYDLEAWAPGQGKWLEISSITHFDSYQARRMKLTYKKDNKKKQYCHTLNGSAFGLPRLLAALLETYQQASHIDLPSALQPYMGSRALNLPTKKVQNSEKKIYYRRSV